jgi:hypothetical protein
LLTIDFQTQSLSSVNGKLFLVLFFNSVTASRQLKTTLVKPALIRRWRILSLS